MNNKTKKILSFIIAIIILFYYLTNSDDINNNSHSINTTNIVTTDLKVYYFDVGQADSILISNNNHNILIDAGNNEDGQKLVSYIKNELKINNLEYVVGTHPHEDHIGGLDDIINNFEVDNIYMPEATTTSKTFEDVLDAISNKKLEITIPEINNTFKVGEADFKVIYTGSDESDLNNTSIVLKMKFGDYTYLFTGDATSKTEEIILENDINVDVLKVGHHGSAYSTTSKFLSKVTPEYAIISVGKANSYNHPASQTLSRIQKYTNKIYMTSELGTILLTSDGKKINIDNFYTDTNG